MEKEPVTKFDLEAAFKALDELDIPVAEKGIAANRVNLTETFANARNNKLKTELLVEDYYDLNSNEDLEQAKTDREEDIAKAKLARIEKIVDLDAESPEDLLPSYVGKVIIQCPQCMTLFYKNPEDIEPSEDDDSVVNVNEVCQHCGNASGYNVIGKVDAVSDEESGNYDAEEAEATEEPAEDELSLDFEEPTEEVDAEGTGEAEVSEEETTEETSGEEETEDELNLDFTDTEEEEEEKEKKEESLNHSEAERDAEDESDLYTEHKTENVSLNEETTDESLNNSEAQEEASEKTELDTDNHSENLTLNEETTVLNPVEKENDPELETWFGSEEKELTINKKPGDGSIAKVKDFLNRKGVKYTVEEDSITLEDGRKIIFNMIAEESVNNSEVQKDAAEHSELETENHSANLTLKEEDEVKPITTYFLDCSGSWREGDWNKELAEIQRLDSDENAIVKVFYFSDKVYDNSTDAFRGGASNGANDVAQYAIAHPEEKCIVRTDDDYKSQCRPENAKALETLPNVELRLRGVDESLTESEEVLTEASVKDLDDKLKAHNEYIDYLKKMIEQEEAALKTATNDEVKAAIQRRLDAFNDDLNAALPEAVKSDLAAEELPTPEEAGAEETTVEETEETEEATESVNKSENITDTEEGTLPDAKTLHEDVITVKVDTAAETPIVTVEQEPSAPIEEPIAEPVCVGSECTEPCEGPECEAPIAEPCVCPECEVVPPVIADIPAVEVPVEAPVEVDPEADTEAKMTADANAAVDELASEFGISDDVAIVEPGEAVETTEEESEEKAEDEKDDDDDDNNNGGMEECVKESAEELTEENLDDEIFDDLKDPVSEEEVQNMMNDLRTESLTEAYQPTDEEIDAVIEALNEDCSNLEQVLQEKGFFQKAANFFTTTPAEQWFEHAANKLYGSQGYTVRVWAPNKKGRTQKADGTANLAADASGNKLSKTGWKNDIVGAKKYAKDQSAALKTFAEVYGMDRETGKRVPEFLIAFDNGKLDSAAKLYNELVIYTLKEGSDTEVDSTKPVTKVKKDQAVEKLKQQKAKNKADHTINTAGLDNAEEESPKNETLDTLLHAKKYSKKWLAVVMAEDATDASKPMIKVSETAYEHEDLAKAVESLKKAVSLKTLHGKILSEVEGTKQYQLLTVEYGVEGVAKAPAVGSKKNGYKDFTEKFTESLEIAANLALIEEIDEDSFANHITESLTKTYENVKNFTLTDCSLEDNKFIIEGIINFKSTKTIPTKYVFTSALTEDMNIILKGLNETLSTEEAFTLTCAVENKKLIAEKLAYSYKVGETLVEGYTGK